MGRSATLYSEVPCRSIIMRNSSFRRGLVLYSPVRYNGAGSRAELANTPRLRAKMFCFDVDAYSPWVNLSGQFICDLVSDSFLARKALGVETYDRSQLGNANELIRRQVPNPSVSVDRQHVVLTQGGEKNRPFSHMRFFWFGTRGTFDGKRSTKLGVTVVTLGHVP